MKFLSKFGRYLGTLLIIIFSAISIFLSFYQRSLDSTNKNLLFSYASFFENRFYDLRMMQSLDHNYVDDKVVLAALDDEAFQKEGRWPWSRSKWVDVLKKLRMYGAKVVAYDVLFPEPEMACNAISPDELFAKQIAEFQEGGKRSVILSYSLADPGEPYLPEIPDSLYPNMINNQGEQGTTIDNIAANTFPIQRLIEVDATNPTALGFVGANADPDGIFRQYKLFYQTKDGLYFPSMALLAYKNFINDEKMILDTYKMGSYLNLIKGKLELSINHETKIRFIGGPNNFHTIGIHKILAAKPNDPVMKKMLGNKIVFIGSTAFGAHDLRHTPIDAQLPGVYFHMNMVHMLMHGYFFKSPENSIYLSLAILLIGVLLILLMQLLHNPLLDIIGVTALIFITLFIEQKFFMAPGYELKLFFCFFCFLNCYIWNTFLNFYLANKDKTFLKQAFGNYISPELIDEMYKSGEPPKLGGQEDVLSAYFTDIASFSSFSEKLTPTQLVELLNEYLTAMTDILLEQRGTLDKYEGDAIIAFFGAPVRFEDHAIRACRVAVRMQDKLLELRKKWSSEGDKWPEVVKNMRMRIGVNSGRMVTGNMGSKARMNYTMMGDSVNLAARLEEAAKQYGIYSHISHFTRNLIKDEFALRELDTILVVGKSEPVTTYDILGEIGKIDENLSKLQTQFHEGLKFYKGQQWVKAIEIFKATVELEKLRWPDLKGKTNPSLIYIERCEEFQKNPPGAGWDGVYTLTHK